MDRSIREQLLEMQDTEYKKFHSRLMPTIDPDNIIGIRVPVLRKFARSVYGTQAAEGFLMSLPHRYYEENNLHAFLLEQRKDYDKLIKETDIFLPQVDNWATCDAMCPKIFREHTGELMDEIRRWISSDRTYTVRFGIGMLMRFYLDEGFSPDYLELVSDIVSEEYYVRMMAAWFFATALAKQYQETIPFIEQAKLDKWTHNMTIRKAVESYRVSSEHKMYLRTLRRHDS